MGKEHRKLKKGYEVLIASAFAFSLMSVCVKHLGDRLPVAEIVLIRALISLLITRVMLKRYEISPWGKNKKLLLVRGLLGTSALFCVFKAIAILPLASATVIQYTYPTFTAIAACFFLKERIGRRIGLAVVIGWVGITLVIKPDWINSNATELPLSSVYIAICGSILTALAYISVRKLSETEHPLVIVHYFPLVSIPITLPFIFSNGVLPIGIEWLWLIGVGLFTQLGQIWITKGLSLLPAAQASSINYSQVIFSTVWGSVLFSEELDACTLLGAFLILLSTLLSLERKSNSLKDSI